MVPDIEPGTELRIVERSTGPTRRDDVDAQRHRADAHRASR
jgi:hypothetical protein